MVCKRALIEYKAGNGFGNQNTIGYNFMISCEHHDYIEIACLYNYRVRLTLDSGAQLEGGAVDTVRNQSKEECIKIRAGSSEHLVVLDSITTMEALIKNPHFKVISFK